MSEPTAIDFHTLDLNQLPPMYSFPRTYWYIPIPARQVTWLLDHCRIDDAVVYFIHAVGASFPEEMPFMESRADANERISRLRSRGRIKLFMEGSKHWYRTSELVLGTNSGIETILRDVEFLSERPNPAYVMR